MVQRKHPKSLKDSCLKLLPSLFTDHVRRMAHKARALQWHGIFEGKMDVDRDELLRRQVLATRQHVYSHVVWYDYEVVFKALLMGVEHAMSLTRRNWKQSSDMTQFRQEMEAMSTFADVVLFPYLRRLDFRDIPKSLRSRVVENLATFVHLRVLVLNGPASGGGQWIFKNVVKSLVAGLEHVTRLEEFSCKHDCTHALLEVVSRRCGNTLKKLDLEDSKGVDDSCVGCIASCQKLEVLNMFNTRVSDEGKARILTSLSMLVQLVRGDFLCDVLGWIDYLADGDEGGDEQAPVLLLTDFFPSQKYYFHEDWQMEMVARICPYISCMFFIFHEQCVQSYLVLEPFEHLTELVLYGGDFYKDRADQLLQIRGASLAKLTLISMTQVNYLAVAIISLACPNLESLGLNNCDLGDYRPSSADDPNSDAVYEKRQAFISMARRAHETVRVFVHLEEVTIQSACKDIYLSFLLGRCPNLRVLHLGCAAEVADETVWKIYAQTGLTHLEEFHCERNRSGGLTWTSLHLLLNSCERLRAVGDIQEWAGLSPQQVGQFRAMCFEQNLDLDTSSHQRLRRYLEMRDYERRTYVNLITGPSRERLRLAVEQRNGQQNAD